MGILSTIKKMMHVFSGRWSLVLVSWLLLAFLVTRQPARATTPLFGNNDENKKGAGNNNNNKYQFGDISRAAFWVRSIKMPIP
jgi:hypothetical protein